MTDDEDEGVQERLREVDLDGLDDRLLGLLAWVLETETRARIYVFLRSVPGSTSDEIADGTGLYPSTVREALAGLHDEGYLTREKRAAAGAGNNPYEYEAIAPSELVDRAAGRVQSELNSVVNLDERLGRDDATHDEPVHITVETETDDEE